MSDFETRFSKWLLRKHPNLCNSCGDALRDGITGLSARQLKEANDSILEIYNTETGASGGDCDYSLPGVGPLYTGHWHGKRVHDALSVFVPHASIRSKKQLRVIDVGSGTGAALWAWTLVACFAKEIGEPVPLFEWICFEQSKSMLEQNDRLWEKLCGVCKNVDSVVKRGNTIHGDWRSLPSGLTGDVVVGSYLFSRKESASTASASTAKQFVSFIEKTDVSRIMLWTKNTKGDVLHGIRSILTSWRDFSDKTLFGCPLSGEMVRCVSVANSAFEKRNLECRVDAHDFNWGRQPAKVAVLVMKR